jgi:exopolysaccharide production protein ExoQ
MGRPRQTLQAVTNWSLSMPGGMTGASFGLLVAGVICGAALAGVAAATWPPLVALGVAGGLAILVLSIRWPLAPLFVFVALVPIEDMLLVQGVGTVSRLVGVVFAVVYVLTRRRALVLGALPVAAWAYLGWAVASTVWSVDLAKAIEPLGTLLQMAAIGFLVADVVIHDPTRIRQILWVYTASATATALVGIASYLRRGESVDVRIAALAGQNPAQFASLLLPVFIFALNELLNRRHVVVSTGVAAIAALAIVLSGTRSVWVAAAGAVLLVLIPQLGLRRATITVGLLALLAVGLLQAPGIAELVSERSATAISSGGAGRTSIWAVGFNIFESSPAVGVGYGNFRSAFTSDALRAAQVVYDDNQSPHSLLVSTAAELGVVGLVLLGMFLVPLVVRRGWGPDGLLVHALLAALMFDALFIDIFGYRKQVWIVLGFACGLAYLARHVRDTGWADRRLMPAGAATPPREESTASGTT